MSLESGTYISDLVATNPLAGDPRSEGDDHIRLIKALLLATFPNITGAITPTHTELNYVDGVTSAIQTQIDNLTTTINAALALKAALASPTFTGVPAAPTAAVSTSTTQLATTAFVMAQTANTSRIGLAEAATGPEALGGTDSTRFVTSSGLASDKTLSGTGHYVLPGGFIINWVATGSLSPDTSTTVSFNKAFTTTCFGTVATVFNSSTSDDDTAARVLANSLTGTTLRAEGMSAAHSGTCSIFAISLGY